MRYAVIQTANRGQTSRIRISAVQLMSLKESAMNIKGAFNHIKQWNEWRKRNTNSKFWKLMVLTGLAASPTLEAHKAYKNWGNVGNIFESKEME